MQEKVCIHCYVSGVVQGVWFRSSTQDEAKKLGLTGWARNLADGRVEVIACGQKADVAKLYEWLQKGPEMAKVEQATYEEIGWQDHERFAVK